MRWKWCFLIMLLGFTVLEGMAEEKRPLVFKVCLLYTSLRIPAWCREARIEINGKLLKTAGGNRIEVITRHWKEEDQLTLVLPMQVTTDTWYENSIAVERGPLVYALKIGEKWEKRCV